MEKKIISSLRWSSTEGEVEFRAVYDDGTVGPTVVRPGIYTDDPLFVFKKKWIERKWVGRKVEFF